jgi:hypothetical protein
MKYQSINYVSSILSSFKLHGVGAGDVKVSTPSLKIVIPLFLFLICSVSIFAQSSPNVSSAILNGTTGEAYDITQNISVGYTLSGGNDNRTNFDWRVNGKSIAVVNIVPGPVTTLGYAIPYMTALNTPSPLRANASSIYDAGYVSWLGWSTVGRWVSALDTNNKPEWLEIDVGSLNSTFVAKGLYNVLAPAAQAYKNWDLNASNDRVTWVKLASGVEQSVTNYNPIYNFSNTNTYRYYRFHGKLYYHTDLLSITNMNLIKVNGTYISTKPRDISTNNLPIFNALASYRNTSGPLGTSALKFPKSGATLEIWNASRLDFTNHNFSIFVRIQPGTGAYGAGQIYENRYQIAGTDTGWMLGLCGSNMVCFDIGGTTNNDNAMRNSGVNAYKNGTWQWIGVVKNGTNITFWVDGKTKGTASFSAGAIAYGVNYHRIGGVTGGFHSGAYGIPAQVLNANISNFIIFNRTLTAQQVVELNKTRTKIVSQELRTNQNWSVLIVAANQTHSSQRLVPFSITYTGDGIAPSMTDITVSSITNTSASVTWTTNEKANSTVLFGLTKTLGTKVQGTTYLMAHVVPISGLTNGTLYYYNISSCDQYGACNSTGVFNFTSAQALDSTFPNVSMISQNSVREDVMTNFNATYTDDIGVTSCNFYINGVKNGTMTRNAGLANRSVTFYTRGNYTVFANCTDSAGNANDTMIKTLKVNDTTAPVITLVRNSSTTNESTSILWTTDGNANSTVKFGTTKSLTSKVSNSSFKTTRSMNLSRTAKLDNSTFYYYNVSSCDISGNCVISGGWNFTTGLQPYSKPVLNASPWRKYQWVYEGYSMFFNSTNCTTLNDVASDLVFNWTVDGAYVSNGRSYTLDTTGYSFGVHKVVGYCKDNYARTNKTYFVRVYNNTDFSILAVGDTQKASAYAPSWIPLWARWVNESVTQLKLQFVAHMGDVVETWDHDEMWIRMSDAFDYFDQRVPFSIALGNHDYATFNPRNTTKLNQWFPYSRYLNIGGVQNASSQINSYFLFNYSDYKFILFQLGICPTNDTMRWVNDTLKTYSDRWGIVTTHIYLNPDSTILIDASGYNCNAYFTGGDYNTPVQQWNKTYKQNRNLIMVLAGHQIGDGSGVRPSVGVNGNTVYQILTNYQSVDWDLVSKIIRFSPADNKIYIETYGPGNDRLKTTADEFYAFDFDFSKTAPTLKINKPKGTSNDYVPEFNGTSSMRGTILYSVDGKANQTYCTYCADVGNFFLYLAEGFHKIVAYVTDNIFGYGTGNATKFDFTVDFRYHYFENFTDKGTVSDVSNAQYYPGKLSFTRKLMFENFSDGNYSKSPYVWKKGLTPAFVPYVWTIANGWVAELSGPFDALGNRTGASNGPVLFAENYSWKDFNASFKMKSADNDGIGFLFRIVPNQTNSYYRVKWVAEGSYMGIEKLVNGTFTALKSITSFYTANQIYNVSVVARGSNLTMWINNVKYLSVVDSSIERGSIGLYSWGNSGSYFANISVVNNNASKQTVSYRPIRTRSNVTSLIARWNSTNTSAGNNVSLQVSFNNGTTWTRATNGVAITSINTRIISYKSEFQTNDVNVRLALNNVNLTWTAVPYLWAATPNASTSDTSSLALSINATDDAAIDDVWVNVSSETKITTVPLVRVGTSNRYTSTYVVTEAGDYTLAFFANDTSGQKAVLNTIFTSNIVLFNPRAVLGGSGGSTLLNPPTVLNKTTVNLLNEQAINKEPVFPIEVFGKTINVTYSSIILLVGLVAWAVITTRLKEIDDKNKKKKKQEEEEYEIN